MDNCAKAQNAHFALMKSFEFMMILIQHEIPPPILLTIYRMYKAITLFLSLSSHYNNPITIYRQ